MPILRRSIVYFDTPGFVNTASVIDAVRERINVHDVNVVVVPATTGKTAEQFSRELKAKAEVVTISEDEAVSVCKRIAYQEKGLLGKLVQKRLEAASEEALRKMRREVFDMTFLPFCNETYSAVS